MTSRRDPRFDTKEGKAMIEIVDQYEGTFQFSPNTDKLALWCPACKMEFVSYEDDVIRAHIENGQHKLLFCEYVAALKGKASRSPRVPAEPKPSKEKAKKAKEAEEEPPDLARLAAALADQTFVFEKGAMRCNMCDVELGDSVLKLCAHLQEKPHRRKEANKKFKHHLRVVETVEANAPHLTFQDDQVWCVRCKRKLYGDNYNIQRHLENKKHCKFMKLYTQQEFTGETEANHDEAEVDYSP